MKHQNPMTQGQRRREWERLGHRSSGMRYSSRWGAYHSGLMVQDLRITHDDAVLVDPTLTRDERDELEAALKMQSRGRLNSAGTVTAFCVTLLLTMLAVAALPSQVFSSRWSPAIPVAALVVSLLVAVAVGEWLRKKGAIPAKFRGRLLTGHSDGDGPYLVPTRAVLDAAKSLGDLENTPGSTNAQVDDAWRTSWDALTSITEESEKKRTEDEEKAKKTKAEAEKEWAATPVDPGMPT